MSTLSDELKHKRTEWLLRTGQYQYVEGVHSFQQFKYLPTGQQIMIFGEFHNDKVCAHEDRAGNIVPFLPLLKDLLTTSDSVVDVFIEYPQLKQSFQQQDRNALRQILAIDPKDWKDVARFHWIDIRYIRHSSFLEVLAEAEEFIRVGMSAAQIRKFLRWHVEPLANEKHAMLDAIYQSAKINKQLDKLKPELADRIRTVFKARARKLAADILTMDWPRLLKQARKIDGMKDDNGKRRQELFTAMFKRPFCSVWTNRDTSAESCVIHMLIDYVQNIAMTIMNTYALSRLFKPYVKKAVVIVGDAHVSDFQRFFDGMITDDQMEFIAEEKQKRKGYNCIEVEQPIAFL